MGLHIPRVLRRWKANQFVFVGIMGPQYIIGFAVVDLKVLTNGFFYIYDKKTGRVTDVSQMSLPNKKIYIAPNPDRVEGVFRSAKLNIAMKEGRIEASAGAISIKGQLDLSDINPLRICTRAGYRDWVYVQKTNPVRFSGEVIYRGEHIDLSSPEYMASIDWTCGYMRRKTCWAWSSISTMLADRRSLGLNLSCGVNETSFTENFFCIDNRRIKVDSVHFEFDNQNLYLPWHITSFDKKVDLTFYPDAERSEHVNAFIIASRFTQMMGTYEGTLTTDDKEVIHLKDCPGFVEDHYAKW
jgi:hypothetical protein